MTDLFHNSNFTKLLSKEEDDLSANKLTPIPYFTINIIYSKLLTVFYYLIY